MATMMHAAATQSKGLGTSPTIKVADSVPTKGTAITEKALAAGGRLRAMPNQMTCA